MSDPGRKRDYKNKYDNAGGRTGVNNDRAAGRDSNGSGSSPLKKFCSALLLVMVLAAALFFMHSKGVLPPLIPAGNEADGTSDTVGDSSSGTAADTDKESDTSITVSEDGFPEYNGEHYVELNGNVPMFPDDVYERGGGTADSRKLDVYEYYGSLDELGRCTYAYGCLGEETMPAEGQDRGDISSVHPSGWAKAQNWERCHLIAWALSAENANPSNLITGTHYLNYDGMRPLEEEVEHYIWNTGNHVLYYVKPWFKGDELVARGVQMCARSVEDKGKGISFNVYCFNVTPGAEIDYNTGIVTTEEQAAQDARVYILNTRSGVFHYPTCDGVKEMSEHNKKEVTATRKELTDQGYTPCGSCEP